jgi:hypothetical protein
VRDSRSGAAPLGLGPGMRPPPWISRETRSFWPRWWRSSSEGRRPVERV